MRTHPRVAIVTQARAALTEAVLRWDREHAAGLTDGEWVGVISGVLGDQLGHWAKYTIRAERHPDDPDKPGGIE